MEKVIKSGKHTASSYAQYHACFVGGTILSLIGAAYTKTRPEELNGDRCSWAHASLQTAQHEHANALWQNNRVLSYSGALHSNVGLHMLWSPSFRASAGCFRECGGGLRDHFMVGLLQQQVLVTRIPGSYEQWKHYKSFLSSHQRVTCGSHT